MGWWRDGTATFGPVGKTIAALLVLVFLIVVVPIVLIIGLIVIIGWVFIAMAILD